MICNRCGHEWAERVRDPIRCPKCMSPLWNTPRTRPVKPKPGEPDYFCPTCGRKITSGNPVPPKEGKH